MNRIELGEVTPHAGLVRDPKELSVAPAVIGAKAEYLVTTDRDFTDVDDTTVELRRRVKPLPVGVFLHDVMGWSHEALPAIEGRRGPDLEQPFWDE